MKKKLFKIFTVALLLIVTTVSCKKDEPVTGVVLPDEVVVAVGKTAEIPVTFIPSNATNKKITCVSSDPNIATVENGKVTGIAVGQTTITVTTQDGGRTAKCLVAVTQPIEPKMIKVEGGTFTMGCTNEQGEDCLDNEKPSHSVTVNSFYMGKYEVTQEEWEAVMGKNPSHFTGSNYPVEFISWSDIQLFIKRLNATTGKNYRLPTEAEWEYAARGGKLSKGYKYSGGNDADIVAWYSGDSNKKTHPVGTKEPNELGIYDMSGNVIEYCQDWYDTYPGDALNNPVGPESGTWRIIRGGAFGTEENYCRIPFRTAVSPNNYFIDLGFRLVHPGD